MSTESAKLRSVLITGASTGIGQACALELDKHGFQVFAGVRNEAAAAVLRSKASPQLIPVTIDVTDAATIYTAAQRIKEKVGERGLFGLVNNAGIAVTGPLEILPIEQLRRQFEVNVIGHIAVTQAMLPMLRVAKGRIVNMGSISGAVASPYLGPYCASKYAMEALTDTLRMELRNTGVSVSIVEPGPIDTPIWEKSTNAANALAGTVSQESLSLYEKELDVMRATTADIANHADPISVVVNAVVHAMTAKKAKIKYFLRFRNRLIFRGFRLVPDAIRDRVVLRAAGLK